MDEIIEVLVKNLSFSYVKNQVTLQNINLTAEKNTITALIGPSGCGKTTLLRCFNRMHDLYFGCSYEGEIIIQGKNILASDIDLSNLRSRVGMVFQKPTAFPMSILDNISYGLKLQGINNKKELFLRSEEALKDAFLWEEVKDKLHRSAYELSGGQQQRLVIARALAVNPQVLLLDEPTSALDPISTAKIEALLEILKKKVTILIVTHNLQQASRIADKVAFFMMGKLVEFDTKEKIFSSPSEQLTSDYVFGRFG
jgi:phosphate transport system ATP-binding protein